MINTIAARYWTRAGDARLIGSMTVLDGAPGLPVGPTLWAAAVVARKDSLKERPCWSLPERSSMSRRQRSLCAAVGDLLEAR
jgi:hypothetical protein